MQELPSSKLLNFPPIYLAQRIHSTTTIPKIIQQVTHHTNNIILESNFFLDKRKRNNYKHDDRNKIVKENTSTNTNRKWKTKTIRKKKLKCQKKEQYKCKNQTRKPFYQKKLLFFLLIRERK